MENNYDYLKFMMIVIINILKFLYIIKINVLGIWEVDVIVKGMIVN